MKERRFRRNQRRPDGLHPSQRRALQQDRERQQAFTSLLIHLPGLSFAKDAQTGEYLACNQAFADYAHRANPQAVAGLTDYQIFDAATAAHFTADDRKALSMDEPHVFYEDVPDAAGETIRHLRTTKLKYTDETGRLCTLGMCLDVTDLVQETSRTKAAYEEARSTNLIYSHIAQTLAMGYTDLFYVNLETEEFLEYEITMEQSALGEARRGTRFFDTCKAEAPKLVYGKDLSAFLAAMERETLMDALKRSGTFVMTYRRISEKGPVYVSMKVSPMENDERFIIIGVTDIDEQMKQRRAAERMLEERIAYTRLNALSGDFLCVYIVVLETGRYREYSTTAGSESFALPRDGMDFFAAAREAGSRTILPEDLPLFLRTFTMEGVLTGIQRSGIYVLSCRLLLEGKPTHVQIRAATVQEKEGLMLVVGINDVDAQVRQEQEYARQLAQAQSKASIDALTGVKNRLAFLDAQEQMDRMIAQHCQDRFAIVILDVNDLKRVNDTAGHQAGDQYLRDACRVICAVFRRCPVYRIGGDEFAVIVQGANYPHLNRFMARMSAYNARAAAKGRVVIACGMAEFEKDAGVAPVFERADANMYRNKNALKSEQS